jgi:sulfate/thiosulfate transport system ATP-binding protein
VLIHWIGEPARGATLAIAASVLRHVPAEAVYVGVVAGGGTQPAGMRELLDARSEAQQAHGLEMRTELHYGDAEQELARRMAQMPGQMLILGVDRLGEFSERFHALLDDAPWPVLIVHRGTP